MVRTIVNEIEERKRRSAEFFFDQLADIDVDWGNQKMTITRNKYSYSDVQNIRH